MYIIIKKILFLFNPERAHNIASFFMWISTPFKPLLKKIFFVDNKKLHQNILGINFKNPVGLAAGFDKNAKLISPLEGFGFGFVEIGTVTPRRQIGNEKPRLFRYPEKKSLQNAMGFNNHGSRRIKQRLLKNYNIPVGVNIGKNKTTSELGAKDDYLYLVRTFSTEADYFAINISSPNTPGLRDLQNEEFIKELFIKAKKLTKKPILLKIAPDLDIQDAINICKIAVSNGANGIIVNNTSIDYSLLPEVKENSLGLSGGISGRVIKQKSYKFFKKIAKEFHTKTTLISIGGIDSAEEAYKRIKVGASLVQIYTSFIYEGPSLTKNINKGILKLLEDDGYDDISKAIGQDIK
ncbi:MAG: Dihydroorotate dehydrogenase (EC [uncultured Campylobacterales bacterium]|uniref:Dihydroorotate dehydrogenase (quinone) n=1 Tax=uncultured Campylobacterales bacterium TaxID=352960 RepID=A0A6S6SAB5_9BACT|nr:MAG: Dihydroorotate dehydrogenase (EC [uncultured Campylobacterales bacterium]